MVSLDDYAWLCTPRGQSAWRTILDRRLEPSRAKIRAATGVKPEQAALLLEQLLFAQGKARSKVELPHQWFWTQKLLEQASDEWTAQETALDAPLDSPRWFDVCCGAGVDTVALAKRHSGLVSVDLDPAAVMLTQANSLMHRMDVQIVPCEAESLTLESDMFLHIDPDRRTNGLRTIDPTRSQPAWSWISEAVVRCHAVSLKLAPGLRVHDAFHSMQDVRPRAMRWLSWDGSVRQQRWYWGVDRWPENSKIVSCGNRRNGWRHEIFARSDSPDGESAANLIDDASQLESGFIADQDPGVRAAGVSHVLAQRLHASCIGDRNGYFWGPSPGPHPMVRWFRILDVVPMDSKRVRAAARNWKACHWELKSRGVDIDLVAMQRQLHVDPASDQRRTFLFTRLGKQRVAILAQRMEGEVE
jgi:hypothetical protein